MTHQKTMRQTATAPRGRRAGDPIEGSAASLPPVVRYDHTGELVPDDRHEPLFGAFLNLVRFAVLGSLAFLFAYVLLGLVGEVAR